MKNFENIKPLKDAVGELVPGICFELAVEGLTIRRGVICKVDPDVKAWFQMKSANADDLFSLTDDLTQHEANNVKIRGVVKYDQFVKKVPAKVRARSLLPGHQHGHTLRGPKVKNDDAHNDDRMYPDLNHLPVSNLPPSSKRITRASPGCSPETTPRARSRKQLNVGRPRLSSVKDCTDAVKTLVDTVRMLNVQVEKLSRRSNKMKKQLKKFFASVRVGDPPNTVLTRDDTQLGRDGSLGASAWEGWS